MRSFLGLVLCAALSLPACSRSDERRFTLNGQIETLDPPVKNLVVKHGEIKGFMPAMTMPYEVRDAKVLGGLAAGDLITATLVVETNGAYLTDIKKTGSAPLERMPPEPPNPSASSGFELLKPGEPVPDNAFVDQDGKKRQFANFKGTPVVMTFIYTKCPLPTFCPLMDRHFAALQKPLKADPALAKVHLVTVSFDPATDTPPVLKRTRKTRGRSRALDVSDRRSRRGRRRGTLRRLGRARHERRARHHPQPPDGHHRLRGEGGEGLHGQRVDA
jgi:protein SCO1/2